MKYSSQRSVPSKKLARPTEKESTRFRLSIFHSFSHARTGRAQLAIFLLGAMATLQTAAAQVSASMMTEPAGRPPDSVASGRATLISHFDPAQNIRLVVGLQPKDIAGQEQLLKDLHDKRSPQFHKFLTAGEWNSRFAPSAQDEQAVLDWAQAQNLAVTNRYANRLVVDLEAPAALVEKALNVMLNNYQLGVTSFFSNDRAPTLPANLQTIVHSVGGLNSLQVLHPGGKGSKEPNFPVYAPGSVATTGQSGSHSSNGVKPSKVAGNGPAPAMSGGAYDPTDLYDSQAYDTNALNALGHCCNPLHNPGVTPPETSIAIATAGRQDPNDFNGFHNQYPYLADHWQEIYIDGTPPCCDGEGTMDMEWATAMANSYGSYIDTAMVYMYDGVNAQFSTFTDIYNQILNDGKARIFSTSWGCTEFDCISKSTMDTHHAIFNAMVGQGWTLVNSSGDAGATAGCGSHDAVSYPASDPNFVAAGGTTLSLSPGPFYNSEVTWSGGPSGCSSNDGGGTGGFSAYWGTPSYQAALGFSRRAVPDISLNADWFYTPQNMYFSGSLQGNGGTSIVAPELAGFFAQENAYLLTLGNICGPGSNPCAPMGNVNHYIYLDGLYGAPHYPFYDVTSGCNNNDVTWTNSLGYFCAGTGYDEATGWGSFNMLQLAWAINWYSTPAIGSPTVAFTGPATNTWYNTNVNVSWTITDNGGGYTPTGVAGFTQGWDSIPIDPTREAKPGSGNSFYSGPQFPNASSGYLALSWAGQGCHTAKVQAWNNMGSTAGPAGYGPICYDTIAPVTVDTLSGILAGGAYVSPVKVTLAATDSGSGLATTAYQVDGGAVTTYSAPFTITALGSHTVTFHSADKAGNVESTKSVSFVIHATSSTSLTSSLNPSVYGNAVTFTATVTSSAGTPTGTVTFKDGASVLGSAALSGGIAKLVTSTVPAGSNSITAVYAGAGTIGGSTSPAVIQTVTKAGTSTALTASVNPSAYGQTVTFTAKVTSATTGIPGGSIVFKDGITVLATTSLNASGVATLSIASLAVGSHSISAAYAGNIDYNASTSAVLSEAVKKTATTTTVMASVNPSGFKQLVTFTAKATSATTGVPSGSVTFKDGATVLGTVVLNASGVATFATAALTVGLHSITASYAGNANFNPSASLPLAFTVNKAATSTTLAASANPTAYNQSFILTAKVTSAAGVPTGTVTLKDGATVRGTASLNASGIATFSIASLAAGAHSLTASYAGSTTLAASTSPALAHTVNKAATSVAMMSSLNPSLHGQAVTFTATVIPAFGGTPTGSITFRDGATILATVAVNAAHQATYTTSVLSAAIHSITGAYSGDVSFAASTSPALSQTVK